MSARGVAASFCPGSLRSHPAAIGSLTVLASGHTAEELVAEARGLRDLLERAPAGELRPVPLGGSHEAAIARLRAAVERSPIGT